MEKNKKISLFIIIFAIVIVIITSVIFFLFFMTNKQNKQCDKGFYQYNKFCYPCFNKFINCNECNFNKCLSCQNGFEWSEEEKKCKTEIKTVVYKNILWNEFNAGDIGGAEIPIGVKICRTNEPCIVTDISLPICWQGNTSGENCNNITGYSGCNRTVCNWYAANKICETNFMKLPTDDEFKTINDIKSNALLHFCSATNKQGDKCSSVNYCHFQLGNNSYRNLSLCFPNFYWGKKQAAVYSRSGMKLDIYDNKSNTQNIDSKAWMAASVRCTLNCSKIFQKGCIDCSLNQCLKCADGFELSNGMCVSQTE